VQRKKLTHAELRKRRRKLPGLMKTMDELLGPRKKKYRRARVVD
jgi:hypothetical protein